MRLRPLLGCSAVAVLLLSGCSATPDLVECQAAAGAHSSLEGFILDRRGERAPDDVLSTQLLAIGSEHEELDVSGELRTATQNISNEVSTLRAYHQRVADGGVPDAAEEQRLVQSAIGALADAQRLCVEVG